MMSKIVHFRGGRPERGQLERGKSIAFIDNILDRLISADRLGGCDRLDALHLQKSQIKPPYVLGLVFKCVDSRRGGVLAGVWQNAIGWFGPQNTYMLEMVCWCQKKDA
jgi:hypothetical protein